jgi:hypothetical protein
MTVTATARRLGMSAVGIVSVVALTVGCSSSSSGKPIAAKSVAPTAVSASTSSAGSAPTSVSVPTSLPTSLPSGSVPVLGGSKFCTDYTTQGGSFANILSSSGDGLDKYLKAWDQLADEAPGQIKKDVQMVSDYLHNAIKGKVDPGASGTLTTALTNITTYIVSNCH